MGSNPTLPAILNRGAMGLQYKFIDCKCPCHYREDVHCSCFVYCCTKPRSTGIKTKSVLTWLGLRWYNLKSWWRWKGPFRVRKVYLPFIKGMDRWPNLVTQDLLDCQPMSGDCAKPFYLDHLSPKAKQHLERCKQYNIAKPPRGYWEKKYHSKEL